MRNIIMKLPKLPTLFISCDMTSVLHCVRRIWMMTFDMMTMMTIMVNITMMMMTMRHIALSGVTVSFYDDNDDYDDDDNNILVMMMITRMLYSVQFVHHYW